MHSQVVGRGRRPTARTSADSIVGLGGGAALDVAKAIALMAHHPGDLFDYEDDKPGARPIDEDIPYWVALPTTAGTGSEVGRSAVISDEQTHVKKIIFSPRLLARAVFADPELTLGLPPAVTAATGMDALTHCIEAYLAKDYHPICDGIALEGLRLARARAAALRASTGATSQARGDMMMASMMGAIAFQKGLGLIHSCAHALSTVADLHHGFANGVMIDHALKLQPRVLARSSFARMAHDRRPRRSTPARRSCAWLRDLKSAIGIPAGLAGTKVPREALDAAARPRLPGLLPQQQPAPVHGEGLPADLRGGVRLSAAVDVGPARGGARLKVVNPATGEVIREVAEDAPEAVARKFAKARARPEGMGARRARRPQGGHRALRPARAGAQRGPGRHPDRARWASPSRSRATSSRALQGRIDFFLANVHKVARRGGGRARRADGRGGEDLLRAARRGRQHLGLELPVLRGLERLRARAAHRQRRALQAVGVRDPHRARHRRADARGGRARATSSSS